MASGQELMMNALLKAMGFDPKQFVGQIEQFIVQTNHQIAAFSQSALSINQRLEAQGKQLADLTAKIDLLISMRKGLVIDGHHEPIRPSSHINRWFTDGATFRVAGDAGSGADRPDAGHDQLAGRTAANGGTKTGGE